LVDQAAHVGFVANVCVKVFGACAKGPQLGSQCLTSVFAAARDNDGGALTGESQRGGATDAGECTCDKDHGRSDGRNDGR
jgi:hypothetical protein